jgi:predicted acyl esterase
MRQEITWAADVDFGTDGYMGLEHYNQLRLQWFDRWLLGIENGVENDAPVHIFVMGGGDGRTTLQGKMSHGGHWRTEQEWPIARTDMQQLYLHSDGSLSAELPTPDDPPRRYTFDPNTPVPTISANVTGFFELVPIPDVIEEGQRNTIPWRARMRSIVNPGATHQRSDETIVGAKPPYGLLAHRADVLVYQTEPLAQPVEVTGQVSVTLWISSSALDTDFTAKLVDVYPPNPDYPEGYQMNLVDSIIRCRYRDSWEVETLMEPGEIYPVTIVLPPTSNLFAAAHRIRVDISSSNFPRFDLNPNTGEPMGRHTGTQIARQTVYSDAAHPSHLHLPVIPS